MHKAFFCALLSLGMASLCNADEVCADLEALMDNAQNEFSEITGEPLPKSAGMPEQLSVYEGTQLFFDSKACAVAAQASQDANKPFSRSYTCTLREPASDDAVPQIVEQTSKCLGPLVWMSMNENNPLNGPLMAKYGFKRISITRHPETIALGVEIFYDEKSRAMGSPIRGQDAGLKCSSKPTSEIQRLFKMYQELDGAEPFEDGPFVGVINREQQPMVAFITRPEHDAHPAIITRSIREENGRVSIAASGDYSGDCIAFHDLLNEVRQMNEAAATSD